MKRYKDDEQGQALIESALIMPLLFLLILNVVNFSAYLYAGIAVANAARTGANYMMMGPAYAGHQTYPTVEQIQAAVLGDINSLPNHATATITVYTRNNTVVQKLSGTTSPALATFNDPQPTTSVVGQVKVSYSYSPLIPFWDFPGLGIHLTLPTLTINRTATTRLVQ